MPYRAARETTRECTPCARPCGAHGPALRVGPSTLAPTVFIYRRDPMPKKLVIPADEPIAVVAPGWLIYKHPPTAADSPLWVCLKILRHPPGRRRMGSLRAFWLYWGVDERRFRRSTHSRRFESEQPAVYAVTVKLLVELLTPAEIESQLGAARLAVERRRLAASRDRHEANDRHRLEAAHAAALAENARRAGDSL